MKNNRQADNTVTAIRRNKLALALMLAATPTLAALYASAASAQGLAADPAAANRPLIGAAANGTPVVNIVAPNAAGVSRNTFTQYNVGLAGLIVNNSGTAVATQLGGTIAGNAQLGATPARVILNEVTGANATSLNGATEIAGRAAHLIVANPNGITANGATFVNATRATLTTGQARFDAAGNLASIDTTGGRIDIQGNGIDARNIDQLDLIARGIEVNAAVQAKKLVGVAGVTRQNLRTDTTTNGATVGLSGQGAAPAVAIDVAQLGSMYANSIRLVGAQGGMGVNGANGANGANGSNGANGANGSNGGNGGNGGSFNISNGTSAGNSGAIVNSGNGGSGGSGGNITIGNGASGSGDAGAISVKGRIAAAAGDVSLAGGSVAIATGANVSASNGVSIASSARNQGTISAKTVSVAGSLDNSGGAVRSSGNTSVSGSAKNAAGTFDVGTATFSGALNNAGGSIKSAGKLNVSGSANNASGRIDAKGVSVAGSLNNAAGRIHSGASIDVGGSTNNTAGTLEYVKALGVNGKVGGTVAKVKS